MAILEKAKFQMDTNKSQTSVLPRIPNDPGLPYMIEYFDFFTNLDTAFESVEASLPWLRDLADALDEGLDLFANGRLAPQIFPPAQMALVLKAVNRQLPLGWAVSVCQMFPFVYQNFNLRPRSTPFLKFSVYQELRTMAPME
jgi:hypothetical protein